MPLKKATNKEKFLISKRVMSYLHVLLTKREVKMAGYWPSSFFASLWTETKSRSIKKQSNPIVSVFNSQFGESLSLQVKYAQARIICTLKTKSIVEIT